MAAEQWLSININYLPDPLIISSPQHDFVRTLSMAGVNFILFCGLMNVSKKSANHARVSERRKCEINLSTHKSFRCFHWLVCEIFKHPSELKLIPDLWNMLCADLIK